MDDLSQQLNQILSDPQSMKQIQDMMGALGLGGSETPSPAPPPSASPSAPPPAPSGEGVSNPAGLAGLFNSLGGGGANSGGLGGISPEMLQMISRMAPLLGQANREDDSTRLLHALRPLLSPPRQKKLDEAVKILHMMRLLPLLKDSGLFSGLLSGLL